MDRKLAVFAFLVSSVLLVAFYKQELLLTAIVGIGTLGILAIDKWKRAKDFVLAMVIGGICENTAVFLGAWQYTNAAYLFTPLWLPIGWGISVVLFEEAFALDDPDQKSKIKFSKRALLFAVGGTVFAALSARNEIMTFAMFAGVTAVLLYFEYYKRSEIVVGALAAIFGTAMETVNIVGGNWQYPSAMFGTPIWLPLCWFNAFLIMRRIIRFGDKEEK